MSILAGDKARKHDRTSPKLRDISAGDSPCAASEAHDPAETPSGRAHSTAAPPHSPHSGQRDTLTQQAKLHHPREAKPLPMSNTLPIYVIKHQ
jgi:hypothetical protein